jgi:hypothetical protein
VFVLGKNNPTDIEWNSLVEHSAQAVQRLSGQFDNMIIFTDGGAPSIVQRRLLHRKIGMLKFRLALVGDSRSAKGVLATIAWVSHRRYGAFDAGQLDDALAFLALDGALKNRVARTIQSLRWSLND